MDELIENFKNCKVRNVKSGGKNTNINGLSFEKETQVSFDNEYIIPLHKRQLYKYFNKLNIEIPHGCKSPDEVFLNTKRNILFIIEKKFQSSGGSVCEKIQTGIFKKDFYVHEFSSHHVVFIFCLSKWFKDNCKYEINKLKKENIKILFGDKENYKDKLTKFITTYNCINDRFCSRRLSI